MSVPNCEYTFSTSVGEFLIVDDRLPRNQAIQYCDERSSVLAYIHSKQSFEELKEKIFTCLDDHGDLHEREEYFYTVGLKTVAGKGSWSDGTEYNARLHVDLFEKGEEPSPLWSELSGNDSGSGGSESCQIYSLVITHYEPDHITTPEGLLASNCDYSEYISYPFLCMEHKPPSSIRLPSSITTIVIVVLLLLALMFVGLAILCMGRKPVKNKVRVSDD